MPPEVAQKTFSASQIEFQFPERNMCPNQDQTPGHLSFRFRTLLILKCSEIEKKSMRKCKEQVVICGKTFSSILAKTFYLRKTV